MPAAGCFAYGEDEIMIVIIREGAGEEAVRAVVARLESWGLRAERSDGEHYTLIGAVGDTGRLDPELLRAMDGRRTCAA